MRTKTVIFPYVLCALFAALMAVFSQIMVPLPFTPIPINLGLLAVWACGGTLGAKKGAIAVLVYILLGAVGVPVFAGFNAGLGALAGPTGGYIVGYVPSVIVFGLLIGLSENAKTKKKTVIGFLLIIARGLPAMAVCYAFGTAWYMITTGVGLMTSLVLCVIPFIPGDVLKVIAAVAICEALRKPLRSLTRAQSASGKF